MSYNILIEKLIKFDKKLNNKKLYISQKKINDIKYILNNNELQNNIKLSLINNKNKFNFDNFYNKILFGGSNIEVIDCTICLLPINADKIITDVFPCNHKNNFHKACLGDLCLENRSNSICPLCRISIDNSFCTEEVIKEANTRKIRERERIERERRERERIETERIETEKRETERIERERRETERRDNLNNWINEQKKSLLKTVKEFHDEFQKNPFKDLIEIDSSIYECIFDFCRNNDSIYDFLMKNHYLSIFDDFVVYLYEGQSVKNVCKFYLYIFKFQISEVQKLYNYLHELNEYLKHLKNLNILGTNGFNQFEYLKILVEIKQLNGIIKLYIYNDERYSSQLQDSDLKELLYKKLDAIIDNKNKLNRIPSSTQPNSTYSQSSTLTNPLPTTPSQPLLSQEIKEIKQRNKQRDNKLLKTLEQQQKIKQKKSTIEKLDLTTQFTEIHDSLSSIKQLYTTIYSRLDEPISYLKKTDPRIDTLLKLLKSNKKKYTNKEIIQKLTLYLVNTNSAINESKMNNNLSNLESISQDINNLKTQVKENDNLLSTLLRKVDSELVGGTINNNIFNLKKIYINYK